MKTNEIDKIIVRRNEEGDKDIFVIGKKIVMLIVSEMNLKKSERPLEKFAEYLLTELDLKVQIVNLEYPPYKKKDYIYC